MGWIVGLIQSEHGYRINGVCYEVKSRFEPPDKGRPVQDAFRHMISGDMVDLQDCFSGDTIDSEYVCSAAGKED